MQRVLRRMSSLVIVLVVSAVHAQAPNPAPSVDDALVAQLKDAKWTAWTMPGAPSGILVWPVAGDGKTGPSMAYAKWPAGLAFPAHWHSTAETTVVISGTLDYVIDGKSYQAVGPGSVVVFPPKQVHQVTCSKAGPCVFLIRRTGATDYHFDK